MLDLTKHDFQTIPNVTGRIFEIGVHCLDGCLTSVVCPNTEVLKQDLKDEHSWLNNAVQKTWLKEFGMFFLRVCWIL
jgi:hypothetical protein